MIQLPLPVHLDGFAVFETFVAERNAAAAAHVEAVARGERQETVWLWGGAGGGKSHLLMAACRAAADAGRRAMYLPLEAAAEAGPEVSGGAERVDLMALDEPDRVAGRIEWERALFRVLEAFQQRGGLVVAAARAPGACGFVLPDLASRAAAAAVYRLQPLGERGRLRAVMTHARYRGLLLEEPAAAYLLNRVERDMSGICRWLERLDRASLAAQRRITIPFIRSALLAADGASS